MKRMVGVKSTISRNGGKLPLSVTARVRQDPEVMMLVDKASKGNFEAFGKLYGMFLNKIYRYAYYQVKDRMTAEDITENVFVKAWKRIATCKGRGRTFAAWLYRIAHNEIIDTMQAKQKIVAIELDDISDLDTPELQAGRKFEYEELAEQIAELPENQRQVIILKFVEGLSNAEIGQILNKSEGAIRILQMRALTAMREKLGGGRYKNEKFNCKSIG